MSDHEPYYTTLAGHAAKGDDHVALCSRTAEVHAVTIDPGQPSEEWIRVNRCAGSGPYVIYLGLDDDHRACLVHNHMAGAVVRLEPVSPDLAEARRKVALGGCAHPDAVPVRAYANTEVVAWLCPGCDEELPRDWDNADVQQGCTQ